MTNKGSTVPYRTTSSTVNLCNKALGQESNNLIPYPGTAPGYKNRNETFFFQLDQ